MIEDACPARRHHDDPMPVVGEPVWCRQCAAELTTLLLGLPREIAAVASLPGGRLAPTEQAARRGGGSGSGRSVSPAADTVDEALRWLLLLDTRLREHLGDDPVPMWRRVPGRVTLAQRCSTGSVAAAVDVARQVAAPGGRAGWVPVPWSPTAAVRYLVSRSISLWSWDTRDDAGRQEDDGPAEAQVIGLQLGTLVTRLRHAAGRDELVHRLAMPCPRCDVRALVRRDGAGHVECRVCGSSWSEEHYEFLARVFAS